jgi:hypothetical protein
MTDESAAESSTDGTDGTSPLLADWLSSEQITAKLRVEVSVYQTEFPKAKLVEHKWNYAIFERWFLIFGQQDMIFVRVDGKVELRARPVRWRDRYKG